VSYLRRYEKRVRDIFWTAHFVSFAVFLVALFGSHGYRLKDIQHISPFLVSTVFFLSMGFFLALILAYVHRKIIDPKFLLDRRLRAIDVIYVVIFNLSFFALVVLCRKAGTAFDFLYVLPVAICTWVFGERMGLTVAFTGGLGLMVVDLVIGRSQAIPAEVHLSRLVLFLIIAYLVGRISDSNYKLFAEIMESEQVKKTILESMPLAVLTCDQNGKITFTNSKLNKLMDALDVENTEFRGTGTQSHGSEEAFWSCLGIGEQLAGSEVHNLEVQLPDRWVLVNKVPLTGANESHLGWVITLSDITDRKEIENQLQQSAVLSALGQMAAGVAHEIRNPLTSARGFVQLVAEKDDHVSLGEVKSHLNVAIGELDRLAQIVSDFLMIASPKEQKLARVDLNGVVEEMWGLLAIKALNNDVVLTKVLAPELPALLGDREQLKQVILHLVDNALAAAGTGGRVRVQTGVTRKGEVCMQVSDSGSGIPDAVMSSIFLPFFSTREDATGLGLAICHRIVFDHKGSISVESNAWGTTFTVRFPAADVKTRNSTVVPLESLIARKQRRA